MNDGTRRDGQGVFGPVGSAIWAVLGLWPFGRGMIAGHLITMRRFLRTFTVGHGATTRRRGGGDLPVDLWWRRPEHHRGSIVDQDAGTEGLFTVEYPDERLPTRERFRVLPMLLYDEEDGSVRCTSCNICAKVCPPQCIWMVQAKDARGKVVPLPEEFYIDMDVCMNCGLCAEYCPFDAIKMDQNFELSNYERHQSHVYSLQDLLVSSAYYARTHPEAWASAEEQAERDKVARKKEQRLRKAREAASLAPEPEPAGA
ncbi:4Fe-4S binding protein [Tautonia sociabilis]|uniref:4Fe-4S dicluster domain-containing protein n=1 Tax=Tautonia sociabilis TaxID=2080755 RepID=A0A432MHF8_9BACT|nr:4Fe-4S binding protein [Tautonia sociabilis]RUL86490.1 4Fe-4S dicluster domain-containing protein [Tautonia sociabilis]